MPQEKLHLALKSIYEIEFIQILEVLLNQCSEENL